MKNHLKCSGEGENLGFNIINEMIEYTGFVVYDKQIYYHVPQPCS